MRDAWLLLIVWNFFDTLQVMGRGVMQSGLKMGMASILNVVGLFLVGVPSAWFFTFYLGMDINGLWIGQIIFVVFLTVVYNSAISMIDWTSLITII